MNEPAADPDTGPTHGPFRALRVYSNTAEGWTEARDKGGDPPRGALLAWCANCGAVGPRARLEGRACPGPVA